MHHTANRKRNLDTLPIGRSYSELSIFIRLWEFEWSKRTVSYINF